MSPSLVIGLLYFEEKHRPVGVRLFSVRVTWGASRTLFGRASVSGNCVLDGLVPTGRIPPQNESLGLN
jgi:hypothetical protein